MCLTHLNLHFHQFVNDSGNPKYINKMFQKILHFPLERNVLLEKKKNLKISKNIVKSKSLALYWNLKSHLYSNPSPLSPIQTIVKRKPKEWSFKDGAMLI